MTKEKVVWIVGASQGIGRALARQMHSEGAHLVLSARSAEPLIELENQLQERCEVQLVDVKNAEVVKKVAEAIYESHGRLDSVIYLAALYHPMKLNSLDIAKVAETLKVNLEGALNLVDAVFSEMKRRGSGQIVLFGSVAGYRGLPWAQPYAATKAAIINLAETLYLEARGTGVDVKLVNPGFVRTRLTDKNNFSMPAIIEPEEAARHISRGLKSSSFEIHFPKRFTLALKLLRLLPYGIYFRLLGRPKT